MLVTNVGGLSEIVPHHVCGYTIPLDTKEISNAICDYFEKNKENEMIENVKKEKQKYEWTTFINTLLELYNSCS
jgi:D-inositol-3-phosphate glycosyltransferase